MKQCKLCGAMMQDDAVLCTMCGGKFNLNPSGQQSNEIQNGTTLLNEEPVSRNNSASNQNFDANSTTVLYETDQPSYRYNQHNNPVAQAPNQPIKNLNQNPVQSNNQRQGFKTQNNPTHQNPCQQYSQPIQQQPMNQYQPAANQIMPMQGMPKPKLFESYKKFWQNYVNFNGRARRSEFWNVVLCELILGIGLGIILAVISTLLTVVSGSPESAAVAIIILYAVLGLYNLATILPRLAIIIRRLHDIGKDWFYIFMSLIPCAGSIIMLVYECTDSQPGANQYGISPKYPTQQNNMPGQPPVQTPYYN